MCTLFNAQLLNKHMRTMLHATPNAMRDGACGQVSGVACLLKNSIKQRYCEE